MDTKYQKKRKPQPNTNIFIDNAPTTGQDIDTGHNKSKDNFTIDASIELQT